MERNNGLWDKMMNLMSDDDDSHEFWKKRKNANMQDNMQCRKCKTPTGNTSVLDKKLSHSIPVGPHMELH